MDGLTGMNVNRKGVDVFKVFGVFVFEVPHRKVGCACITKVNARKFKDFQTREHTRGITRQGPDDIGNAVTDLTIQFRRVAAQRHGREDFKLDTAV